MSSHPPPPPSGAGPRPPGPDPDAWLRAARRRELPVVIGVAAFGIVLVVLGRASVPLVVLGLWIVGVGVILLAGRFARDRQERGQRQGRSAGTGPVGGDGAGATVPSEHRARGPVTAVLTAWPGVLLLAAAALGTGSGMSVGVVVACCVVGLAFVVAGLRRAV